MKNPYDIYNDNRAYFGYERFRKDIKEYIKGIENKNNGRTLEVLEEILEVIDEHV